MTLTKTPPKRHPNNYRKRTGQHHKQGYHYAKAYWPYLPVFAALLFGIVLNGMVNHSHRSVLGYATSISPRILLAETNGERSAHKQAALQLNNQLTQAAQAKANDMAKRNYWSHNTPDGQEPWVFVDNTGYAYQAAGENLAYGFSTSNQVVQAWMQSPEHRANMLNSAYQDVGFATANIPNYQGNGPETVVVAMYGEPAGAISESSSATDVSARVLGSQTKEISRIQLVSNNTHWVELSMVMLCAGALMLFFIRHSLAWHRVLVRGEEFVLHHPFLDAALMSLVAASLVLAHAAGSIL